MRDFIARYVPTTLGLLLLYSGIHKIFYPGEATYAIVALDIPYWVASPAIVAVTAFELYLGAILFLKLDLKHGLIAATALMFGFTAFLWYLSTLAHPPSCGCMGLTGIFNSNKKAAVFGLLRNCLILWALKLSYDYYFKSAKGAEMKA